MRVPLGNVGHAYIFAGEGTLLAQANAFAKALNCLEGNETPCDSCISCRVFASGNHPDTVYVTPSNATGYSVEDVRNQVVKPMATKPFSYRYKVFILDNAEKLNHQAQNALLKTIEEPAPYGVFLLLTPAIEAMLPTVISRCVVVKYNSNAQAQINEADEAVQTLAREVAETAHKQDILGALALYKKFEPFKENKESLQRLLDMLYTLYGKRIRETGEAHAFRATEAIMYTKQALAANGNFQLAIELMLLKICGCDIPQKVVEF